MYKLFKFCREYVKIDLDNTDGNNVNLREIKKIFLGENFEMIC